MRSLLVAVLAVTLVGCGDRDSQVDFGGDELGPDLHAIHSRNGAVKMGLTQEWVYFALSDSTRAEAAAELESDAEAGGVKGFFGGIMRSVVGRALDFRAKYAVDEIRDIRWENGRMVFEFVDPDRQIDRNLQIGDEESVTESFDREAVEAFGEVFRTLKGDSTTGDTAG